MASRKVKHQRALEKRELFFKTVKEGNQNWLAQEQSRRLEESKKTEEARKERAVKKSKQLARENGKAKPDVQTHKPLKDTKKFAKVRRQTTRSPQVDGSQGATA